MGNNYKKRRYGAGLMIVSLVIGLSIGFCAGFIAGGRISANERNVAEESERIQNGESVPITESGNMEEAMGNFAVDDEPVLTIDGMIIYLSEVNARAYMARDQYVSLYGEEPWNQEIEDGVTVAEYAKNAMLDEMERATILCSKADDYEVEPLTEEEREKCASRADDYMASLGSDVAAQFSVEREAIQSIYEKEALSMKVYNKILEELTVSLRMEDDYKNMDDSEFEAVLMERFNGQYEQWKNESVIEATDTWNQMVIGAVG